MNRQLTREIESRRQQLAMKSMYFNRFLLVRYITAMFFFAFLNWTLAMWLTGSVAIVFPAVLFILSGITAFEQIHLYNQPKDDAVLTSACYKIFALALSGLFIASFTPLFSTFFPFLNQLARTQQAVVFVIIFAILVTLVVLKRLAQIKQRTDKQYQRIQAMQAVLN